MAKLGYNGVILVGNLTHDAQKIEAARSFGCRYSVAVTRKVPRTGEEFTDYVLCVQWNSERVFPYLIKGREVFVTAHIEQRKRELTIDGETRNFYYSEVITDLLRLMGDGNRNGEDPERRELVEYAEQRLTEEQEKLLQDRNQFEADREQFERAKAAFWQEHAPPSGPRPKKTSPAKPAAKPKAPVRRGRG